MLKLLINWLIASSLLLGGCSWSDLEWRGLGLGDAVVEMLDELPLIYRPTINQGNIIKQDDLNRLRPGMTKRQVNFILGTPMLVDVFHGDRWDYVYTTGVGSRPEEITKVTLHFVDDRLVRVEGDYRPEPIDEEADEPPEVVVKVPDWEGDTRPWWKRMLGIDPID